MTTYNDRERFDQQLLDPCLLSRFFSYNPSLELSTPDISNDDSTVDYLDLRRHQNVGFAEKQLNDGRQALQQGDWKAAKQHFQQGLDMIPNHEALKQALKSMHLKTKPALASKSERNLRNAALEIAFTSEAPSAIASSTDPKYPILNEEEESSRRHNKRSKKQKKEKYKKKKKEKEKKKRKKPKRSSSISSSTTEATTNDIPSYRKRKRNEDNCIIKNDNDKNNNNRFDNNCKRNSHDEGECEENDHDDDNSSRLLRRKALSGRPKKRKCDDDYASVSSGTVDSLKIIRKHQRY